MSGDEFYELAQAKEKELHEVSRQKEAQKEGQVTYEAAVEEWAMADTEWKDEWDTIKANNAQMKAAWEKRKDAAVKKNKKFTKPKLKSIPLPKAIPRPKLKDFLGSRGGVVGAGEAEDDARECHGFVNLCGLMPQVPAGAGVGCEFVTLAQPVPVTRV